LGAIAMTRSPAVNAFTSGPTAKILPLAPAPSPFSGYLAIPRIAETSYSGTR
jgi:hypothetical protein